jgi:outer membrane immunogenic protein
MEMRTVLLAGTAGVALAPMANAADLPAKARIAAPPPAPSWAGWYIGAHAGGALVWGENSVGGAGYTPNSSAFIGGGQIGYNWQKGNFVIGIEVDGSGLTKGKNSRTDTPGNYITYGNHLSWLSTGRLRMGLAVNDTMVYFTGGVAVGKVKFVHNWNTPDYSQSKTRVGWVVGGGIQHMWTRNWVIGLEALFVDFGKSNPTNTFDAAGDDPIHYSHHAFIGRFRLDYKF